MINIIAVINVFGIIADHQRWGQKEKASAFERKYARKLLRMKMKELDDRAKIEKIIEEKFSFIDFEKNDEKCGSEIYSYVEVEKRDD